MADETTQLTFDDALRVAEECVDFYASKVAGYSLCCRDFVRAIHLMRQAQGAYGVLRALRNAAKTGDHEKQGIAVAEAAMEALEQPLEETAEAMFDVTFDDFFELEHLGDGLSEVNDDE